MPENKSQSRRFFDESYRGRERDLQLLLQADRNYLYAAWFDPEAAQMVGLEERQLGKNSNWYQLSESLAKTFSEKAYNGNYQKVSFALIDPTYTLIPSALFEEEKKDTYLNLNFSEIGEDEFDFMSGSISSLQLKCVFPFPKLLRKSVENSFEKVNLYHYTTPLLEAFSIAEKAEEELQLHLQYDRFDLIHYADGKLKMLNSFHYQTVEDFIYYLLYVMEQSNINRNKVELKMYGEFEQNSTLYDTLFRYIRHPRILDRTKAIQYSQPLMQIPSHQYYNLFNQYLCA